MTQQSSRVCQSISTPPYLILLVAMIFLLLVPPVEAPAQNVIPAVPRSETTYQPPLPRPPELSVALIEAVATTETHYNPLGTTSESNVGLISTRRDELSHQGFLLGMQDAALRIAGKALNVAPLTALTLEEQADALKSRGVEIFLIDSPRAADARRFIESAKLLGMQTVLITDEIPADGLQTATLANLPVRTAQVSARVALSILGGKAGTVVYLLTDDEVPDEKTRTGMREAFHAVFAEFRKDIDVVEPSEDRDLKLKPGPVVICALTPRDSSRLEGLASIAPGTMLVCVGESPGVMGAAESGAFNYRVRPNYEQIYRTAIEQAKKPSGVVEMPWPVADKSPESLMLQ